VVIGVGSSKKLQPIMSACFFRFPCLLQAGWPAPSHPDKTARGVACPTLVFHVRHDARVPFEEGRALAALIPGARFAPLNGHSYVLLENEPGWATFSAELESFWFCRDSVIRPTKAARPARSESQRVELVGCRRCSVFDVAELALADHVHDLDAGEQNSGATKGLEPQHRRCCRIKHFSLSRHTRGSAFVG
jgi:hypothetical protein